MDVNRLSPIYDEWMGDALDNTELHCKQLAALAHPVRQQILHFLGREQQCCCKDVVGHTTLAQSTISQHLKVLVDAGLVKSETVGQKTRFCIAPAAFSQLQNHIAKLAVDCGCECKSIAQISDESSS